MVQVRVEGVWLVLLAHQPLQDVGTAPAAGHPAVRTGGVPLGL